MSKILTICFRKNVIDKNIENKLKILSKHLVPDNITPTPPKIIKNNWVVSTLINPCESLLTKNSSICMGNLIRANNDWWKTAGDIPDGSFALIRCNNQEIELITDSVGSRTIWYAKTNELFIASTSQRAIIMWLQEFVPAENVYSWMLSSGILGPELSWDKRIRCLPSNARLTVNRKVWNLTLVKDKIQFLRSGLSDKAYELELYDTINKVFEFLDLDISKWILALSGGRDSRAVLLMLLNNSLRPKCLTWGIKSSIEKALTDAFIAKKIAVYFNLDLEFFEMDYFEHLNMTVDRFLLCGEGRIDNISAYMDGFRLWKQIYELGVCGIIRGDEAFGYRPIENSGDLKYVKKKMGLTRLSEYENLKPLKRVLSEFGQDIPDYLNKSERESVDDWRDRIDHEFQMPLKYAALNDLKFSYVEVITPLLSRSIMECIKKMPSRLRTDKKLFKNIVNHMGPDIGFAETESFPSLSEVVYRSDLVAIVLEELRQPHSKELLSEELIEFLVENIKHNINRNIKLYHLIRRSLKSKKVGTSIQKFKKSIRTKKTKGKIALTIDINLLAFRAFIVCKMYRILTADAKILKGL